jgi:thioredoxin 1
MSRFERLDGGSIPFGSTNMKILDFYADWCGPCKVMAPTIEALESEGFDVEKIDIEADRSRATEFKVMSIPTLIILDGEKEVKRFRGITNKDEIIAAMQ